METNITYPLFDFFLLLQQKYSLRLDDYHSLLAIINQDRNIKTEEKLLCLCKALWLKNNDDNDWFENSFCNFIVTEKTQFLTLLNEQNTSKEPKLKKSERDKPEPDNPEPDNQEPDEQNPKTEPDELRRAQQSKEYETLYLSAGDQKAEKSIGSDRNEMETKFHFSFSSRNFMPLAERPLQINWRSLRNMVYETDFETIDVATCVKNIAEKGFIAEIPYAKELKNSVQLVTMIDNYGSMSVFRWLVQQTNDIISSQITNNVYYCYNLPIPNLFLDRELKKKVNWKQFHQTKLNSKYVIIISDAGATKGSYSRERIEKTKEMIVQIRKTAKNIIWLNPMPNHRWRKTSAIYISLFVKMFELSETGIMQAIQFLKNNNQFQPIK